MECVVSVVQRGSCEMCCRLVQHGQCGRLVHSWVLQEAELSTRKWWGRWFKPCFAQPLSSAPRVLKWVKLMLDYLASWTEERWLLSWQFNEELEGIYLILNSSFPLFLNKHNQPTHWTAHPLHALGSRILADEITISRLVDSPQIENRASTKVLDNLTAVVNAKKQLNMSW